ncbi:MAG: amidase family protein, partial [Candidatus Thorarchaeota archaeon]
MKEQTILQLQEKMSSGKLTSKGIVEWYLDRIEKIDGNGPRLNSIIEINRDAVVIAESLDMERAEKGPRGLMHGIPVVLKDNI